MTRNDVRGVVAVVLIAIAIGIFIGATALGGSGNGLHFKIVGHTYSARYYGGTLYTQSSGFTPFGTYTTKVWCPNGKPYPYVQDGSVAVDGSVSDWHWSAGGSYYYGMVDPPGKYKVVVYDDSTGRATQPTYFTIEPSPAKFNLDKKFTKADTCSS